jgi:hypothetical protein
MLARFRKKVRSRLFRALGIVRSRQEVTFFRAFRPLAVAICANAIANVATEARVTTIVSILLFNIHTTYTQSHLRLDRIRSCWRVLGMCMLPRGT